MKLTVRTDEHGALYVEDDEGRPLDRVTDVTVEASATVVRSMGGDRRSVRGVPTVTVQLYAPDVEVSGRGVLHIDGMTQVAWRAPDGEVEDLNRFDPGYEPVGWVPVFAHDDSLMDGP